MLLKKSGILIAISALIAVNLAIQIARFNSYTLFMKGLNLKIEMTDLQKSATNVKAKFSFDLTTKEKETHAYVSGIQLLLKIGDADLGYHPIVGDQDMLGEFKDGKFHYTTTIKFSNAQAADLLAFLGKKKISYKAYVELHVVQGRHNLRSVPALQGNVMEAIK